MKLGKHFCPCLTPKTCVIMQELPALQLHGSRAKASTPAQHGMKTCPPCKAFLFCWIFCNLSTRMDHIIQMGAISLLTTSCELTSHPVPSCSSFPHVLWAFAYLLPHQTDHTDVCRESCVFQQRMSIFLSTPFLFSHLRTAGIRFPVQSRAGYLTTGP